VLKSLEKNPVRGLDVKSGGLANSTMSSQTKNYFHSSKKIYLNLIPFHNYKKRFILNLILGYIHNLTEG
jgi:hypothetical protein